MIHSEICVHVLGRVRPPSQQEVGDALNLYRRRIKPMLSDLLHFPIFYDQDYGLSVVFDLKQVNV